MKLSHGSWKLSCAEILANEHPIARACLWRRKIGNTVREIRSASDHRNHRRTCADLCSARRQRRPRGLASDNAAAIAITGPVIVERKSLEIGKARISLRLDSSVAAFKAGQDRFPAHIYAVTRMSNPVLLGGQTLCGDRPPTWIVVVPQPPLGLELDIFASVEKPTSPASPGLCNTLTYVR